ncbi:HD domain-containing protein [Candidatus Peregrinibacteria bacterium]|jgi:GTP diphosphokinase / guanosine-3',5'-bis(diphosphate) 3'-diphosphatase|nr:HD domain-containing protein [Candidatus Peregrinibacteria bacterium]
MNQNTQLKKAIRLAHRYHCGQKRKTGEEYILHPLRVMSILMNSGFHNEVDILVSAVLHDICEDTLATNVQIQQIFGQRVGFIVNALSKNKKPQIHQLEKEFHTEEKPFKSFEDFFNARLLMYTHRLYRGIMADPYIMFIKLADQIDNVHSIYIFPKKKQKRIIAEIERFFIPMYIQTKEMLYYEDKKHCEALLLHLKKQIQSYKNMLYAVQKN